MSNLRDTIEGILIDSTKGISTYEASMVNIIINKDQATEAILQAIEERLPLSWEEGSKSWNEGWNQYRAEVIKRLGL